MRSDAAALAIAPLLLRVGAFLIDAAIFAVLGLAIAAAVDDLDGLSDRDKLERSTFALLVITGAVYHIGFLAATSATPGKMAFGLYVGDKQGARIRPDTAILRYLVLIGGQFIVVGFIASIVLVLIDPSRRALHDRIAGTLVLRRPETEPPRAV